MTRVRVGQRGAVELTGEARMAVTDPERWQRLWGSKRRAAAAWQALGGALSPATGSRPEVWWYYTAGVPERLRESPQRPDPRPILYAPATPEFLAASTAADVHRCDRQAWLNSSGHLSPDEMRRAEGLLRRDRRVVEESQAPDTTDDTEDDET